MPIETRELILKMYADILDGANGMNESLRKSVSQFEINDYPKERAFVSTLTQSLGELATVARIAADTDSERFAAFSE